MSTATSSVAKLILDLIAASGEAIETRIRIQKLAYLAKRLDSPELKAVRFSYHHYGPYSRELSDVLQDLVSVGLLKEEVTSFAEGQKYSYSLTAAGRHWLEEFNEPPSNAALAVAKVGRAAHWRALELAATIAFLKQEERIDDDSAMSRSLSLKPDCAPYKSAASRLLTDLRI